MMEALPQKKRKIPKLIGSYVTQKTLGIGNFGKVKLAHHIKTNQLYAIKLIRLKATATETDVQSVEREIRIMRILNHHSIVKMHDLIRLPELSTTVLVLEYVGSLEGGELFDYIVASGRLREKEAAMFFRQVIVAVEYMHYNLVVHRDLKPENILLDSNKNVKISDFGLSNVMQPGKFFHTHCGSPLYSAPEIILAKDYIGPEVDIWALGVILFAMVTGELPWVGNTTPDQLKQIIKGNYEIPSYVSPDCRNLITVMLNVDPKKRATMEEIRLHPWVNKGFKPLVTMVSARPLISREDINQETVQAIVNLGFNENDVMESLVANDRTKMCVILYYIIQDSKVRGQQSQSKITPPTLLHRPSLMSIVEPRRSSHLFNRGKLEPIADEGGESNYESPQHGYESESITITTTTSSTRTSISFTLGTSSKNKVQKTQLDSCIPSALPKILQNKEKDKESSTPTSTPQSPVEVAPEPVKRKKRMSLDIRWNFNDLQEWFKQKNSNSPKIETLGGAFTTETTTSKDISMIQEELHRVLTKHNITYKTEKQGTVYVCQNITKTIQFEIKIGKIKNLQFFKGLKFKRTKGNTWLYKQLYEQLCKELKL